MTLSSTNLTDLIKQRDDTFAHSLVEIGGIESVLVCFADLIRTQKSPEAHSFAFETLLRVAQSSPNHLSKFLDELNGLKLVEFILNRPECIVSPSMLGYYFSFCMLHQDEPALIESPEFIYHLLNCWPAWHKDSDVTKLLYKRLVDLLTPKGEAFSEPDNSATPNDYHIIHNFRAITEAGGLDILMGILRESLAPLDDESPNLTPDLVELIIKLISLLIKNPPSLDVILDVVELMLFLHPDPNAYVECNDRVSFLHDIIADHDLDGYQNSSCQMPTPMSEKSSLFISNCSSDSVTSAFKDLNPETNLRFRVEDDYYDEETHEKEDQIESTDDFKLSTEPVGEFNLITADTGTSNDQSGSDGVEKQMDGSDTTTEETNRNHAIACIADMLASIVKITRTDPTSVLSEALQKPIIDPRKLIVMANNSSVKVREKVFRLFLYCVRACYQLNLRTVLSKYEHERRGSKFKTCVPIHLMANQLTKYTTTMRMIHYCYGIIVGIEDFESIDNLCLVFDVETTDNNLQINLLILLIHLMSQLRSPEEICSTLKFVHAYIKQLIDLGEEDLINILLRNSIVDSLMRMYFNYTEYRVNQATKTAQMYRKNKLEENDANCDILCSKNRAYEEVCHELDQTLVSIICFFKLSQDVEDSQRSVEDLLQNFDLMNSYIPVKYHWILGDRKVHILNTALAFCWNNEKLANKRRNYSVRVGYYLRSLLTNSGLKTNFLSDPRLVSEAIKITQDVVNDKNEQRKLHLEEIRRKKVMNYHLRQQWLSLIIGQTHERATWHDEKYHPRSWELSPVEGPSRMRRRLRLCKLMLDKKFLRSPDNDLADLDQQDLRPSVADWFSQYSPHPLCSMVIHDEQTNNSNELRTRMFTTDKIHFHCDCSIIRPNEVCDGEISIATWCIHFIGERGTNQQYNVAKRVNIDDSLVDTNFDEASELNPRSSKSPNPLARLQLEATSSSCPQIPVVEDFWFDEIVEIWDRRYQLQEVGLEIFLTNNMAYLISFRSRQDRDDFKRYLMREQRKMINLQRLNMTTNLGRLTELWREGLLTNFDYLTCLNKLAGRSFNDLMQYPIFPFVLSNYTGQFLDLTKPGNFRNLKRPMAVQNREREEIFVSNYNNSKATNMSIGLSGMTEPYHYGNHYSNSATVLHFLVRLPPFTQMLIQYQDNNFDQPDRTFHSMANTWQLITSNSTTDFKELIPEFFFLPEMFTNHEDLELGRKQNNELVDDVILPPWCPNSDPRLFTLIHRQALESAYVSEHLNHWIDLIFGFKQTGRAAVEALNVFHPATYYGMIDLNSSSSLSNQPQVPVTPIGPLDAKSTSSGSTYLISTNDPRSSPASFSPQVDSLRAAFLGQHHREIERLALETMIKTYGQMPRQLFSQPVRHRAYRTYTPLPGYNSLDVSLASSITNPQPVSMTRFEPLLKVKGIRWGSFVGSPDESDITAVKHKRMLPVGDEAEEEENISVMNTQFKERVKFSLYLLPNGEVAVLRDDTSLILDYRTDRKSSGGYQLSLPTGRFSKRVGLSSVARMNLFSSMIISRQQLSLLDQIYDSQAPSSSLNSMNKPKFSPESLSLVSWSHLDGIIRLRNPALMPQRPTIPLVQANSGIDTMTTCASVPELNLLLVGYQSGAVCAHIVSTTPGQTGSPISSVLSKLGSKSSNLNSESGSNSQMSKLDFMDRSTSSIRTANRTSRWLYCHRKRITCMKINVSFGVVVTGSEDGTSAIWDLNSLTYVRTIDYKLKQIRLHNRRTGKDWNNRASPQRSELTSFSNPQNHRLADYLCVCDKSRQARDQRDSTSRDRDDCDELRSVCACRYGVSLIAISDTLGDIVTVKDFTNRLAIATDRPDGAESSSSCERDLKSLGSASLTESLLQDEQLSRSSVIYVHTINGKLVGFVDCNIQVTSVCYSTAPEGISVNVIVVGLVNGLVRLYSSWDLSRVKEFHVAGLSCPISSLLYSRDNQLLYVAYETGQLVVLRNKKRTSLTVPKQWFL